MSTTFSPTLSIAISMFVPYAVGDSIEARFKNCITSQHVSDACFMTTSEDEQFRAVVGAVMLSYGVGSPEFALIEAEISDIQKISAYITACAAGLEAVPPEIDETTKPIGLLRMWHAREKR